MKLCFSTPILMSVQLAVVFFILSPASFAWADDIKHIEDNSFLAEEAFNQESGVVQHISSWNYMINQKEWFYTFVQEWPVPNRLNQLSYTIPVSRIHERGTGYIGMGDVQLNYRLQAYDGPIAAFAPRVSLLFPTGDYKKGLGTGSIGVQVNLPLSVHLGRYFITHLNAGGTVTPKARYKSFIGRTNTYAPLNFSFAGSVIWLAHKNFNVMLEGICSSSETPGAYRGIVREYSYYINPGFRFAINHESGLQIVPGLSFPVGFGSARGDWGVLVYLSFEHEMWSTSSSVKK